MSISIHPVSSADAAVICKIYNHYVLDTTISFEPEVLAVADMEVRIAEISAQFL